MAYLITSIAIKDKLSSTILSKENESSGKVKVTKGVELLYGIDPDNIIVSCNSVGPFSDRSLFDSSEGSSIYAIIKEEVTLEGFILVKDFNKVY